MSTQLHQFYDLAWKLEEPKFATRGLWPYNYQPSHRMTRGVREVIGEEIHVVGFIAI